MPETVHCHRLREVRKAVERAQKETRMARKAARVARARNQVEVSMLR